jgi:tight adherence protein B
VLTLLVTVISRSIFATVATLVLTALVPPAILRFLAGQRKRKFQTQLPDMLQLMAGSLRAGYSLLQGVEAVAQEVDEPMGSELRRVLAEARLGRTLEDSLDDMAERLNSRDFAWAVMAIRIQREVGGNLAELLSTVAETMIARERLRREVRALTAEGRISAIILGLLPVGLVLVMYSINREYMNVLLHDGFGQVLLIGAGLLAGVGFYWMKKTIEIDI